MPRVRSASTGSGSGTSVASGVAVTPVGGVTSSDVQSALAELDSKKATPAQIASAVAALVNSAPGILDTLGEIAAALQSDESAAAALATLVASKAPLISPALTGNPTAPTQAAGDNSTKLATTAYVDSKAAGLTEVSKSANYTAVAGDNVLVNTNGRTVTDGVTNGTTTVTSATAAFVAGDVGKQIDGLNITAGTTIASVTNGTTAVLSATTTGSATAITFTIGSNVKITLPVLSTTQRVSVQNIGKGTVTVVPTSGTLDGLSSLVIGTPYTAFDFTGDGTNVVTEGDPYAGTRIAASNLTSVLPTGIRNLQAGLGKAGTGSTSTLSVIGTSISYGADTGSRLNAWPYRLCSVLLPQLGIPFAGAWATIGTNGSGFVYETRWTFAGGFAVAAPSLAQSTTAGATATMVSDTAGTIVSLVYLNQSAAFTVAIDGGAAVTVTPTGASSLGTYTVTGLANTTHTVVVTASTASTTYVCCGGVFATSGMRLINFAIPGSTQTALQGDPYYGSSQIARYLAPAAIFHEYLANEDATLAAYGTKVAAYAAANVTASVDTVLLTTGEHNTSPQKDTAGAAAIRGIGQANGIPVVDINSRWGAYAAANARGLYAVTAIIHPSASGQADMAQAVAALCKL